MKGNDWGFASVWNGSLENRAEREIKARDNLWASELGRAPIELFLKMKGMKPTNPPNARSLRKFEAGNIFEWLVSLILKRAGILKEAQKWTKFQYPGLLAVTGKADFVAGGMPDYEQWEKSLEMLELPEFFLRATRAIKEHFQTNYPEGLSDKYLEIKSVSAFMFEAMEKTHRSQRGHRMQLFHYLKGENYPRGNVVYICRDDLRIMEVPITNPGDTEAEYKGEIEKITKFYNAFKDTPLEDFIENVETPEGTVERYKQLEGAPAPEKHILFDEDMGKFTKNWNVEYSNYLTFIYGFKEPMEFYEAISPVVSRWNRVLARVKTKQTREAWLIEHGNPPVEQKKIEGRKGRVDYIEFADGHLILPEEIQKGYEMTEKNLAVISEIEQAGFNIHELASKFAGENASEEEN